MSKATPPPRTTAEEIREATREAHQALKDLRAERRALAADLAAARDSFQPMVDKAAYDAMKGLADETAVVIKDATERVYARFDRIANILVGKERSDGTPRSEPSLEELADASDVLQRAGHIKGPHTVDMGDHTALVVEL